MDTATNTTTKGAEWLIREPDAADTFTPEQFTEEQTMVKNLCADFLESEVLPVINRIDQMEEGLMQQLIGKAGEQGLLGVSVPENYGGLGKDFITSTLVNEGLGGGYSFSVGVSAHTGIGTLPLLYFGTEAQKEKYISKLASGEWKGAYGLTEPNSGSDALSASTTAVLSDDKKFYLLNGQKCWITNGGFADIYTVFAKVDGTRFTAFIVEKDMEGFTRGPEEHKMGIRGSSTVQLYFQDCKVPAENVLGEVGRGHVIAFNILNIGRLKLCAAALGGAKRTAGAAIRYALERHQFKQPIASFGAIKSKIADMAIRIWVNESALYRTASWIDQFERDLVESGRPSGEALLSAAEEYAIECAILKVSGSEMLDFVVDEAVQIHGGNGFSDEYDVSRAYRDSRINRIYEGTNEINRLLIVDMILKRAMKGRLDLMGPAMKVSKELMSIPEFGDEAEEGFAQQHKTLKNFKKAILLTAGAAVQKLMTSLEGEQEILMHIADMAILTFLSESAVLRAERIRNEKGAAHSRQEEAMMNVFLYDAADKIGKHARDAMNAFGEGDELRMMLLGVRRFTKMAPYNSKEARRTIADKLLEIGNFPL